MQACDVFGRNAVISQFGQLIHIEFRDAHLSQLAHIAGRNAVLAEVDPLAESRQALIRERASHECIRR